MTYFRLVIEEVTEGEQHRTVVTADQLQSLLSQIGSTANLLVPKLSF